METFTYFPLYTLDYIQGTVLFPGGYQLATLDGNVDLRAQTSGTTGVTYSWNTSNLDRRHQHQRRQHLRPDLHLADKQFGVYVDSVTLTATNASSQQEIQTYYFVVPAGSTSASAGTAAWPTTLSPDTVGASAPSWSGDGVSVNADSGALDTTITLPSYNPNVPALALTYDSLTANPDADHRRAPHARPDPGGPVRGQRHVDVQRDRAHDLVLQHEPVHARRRPADRAPGTNATSLAHRPVRYSVQVVDDRSGTPTTFTYSGTATVLNQSIERLRRRLDARGPGADHLGLRRRDPRTWATTARASGSRAARQRRRHLHQPGGRFLDADQDLAAATPAR